MCTISSAYCGVRWRPLAIAALLAIAGCSPFQPRPAIPAPAGSIAAALLSHDRVAVLAGNDEAKAVFLIDLKDGMVRKSFGVTREATGLAAESDDGPLLLAVGGIAKGRPFGAVERWSLSGAKTRVRALPSRAFGITRNVDGLNYVLLAGKGRARAALPLESPSLRVGRAIPLDASASGLQSCRVGPVAYLVYSDERGLVTMRGVDSGAVVRSSVVAANPDCGDDGRVYAIQRSFITRSVAILSGASLSKVGTIPVANDALVLCDAGDALLELDATPTVATLERLSKLQTFETAAR